MSNRIFVIRHGETDWSRERRFSGSRDVALSEVGRRQSEAVAEALAAVPLAAAYTSPLERTRTSAEIIAKPHRLTLQVVPALREMAFGDWEGLTREDVAERAPALYDTWRHAPHQVTPPGGEALADVAARVTAALEEIRNAEGETVVVVTHAIVVRLIVLEALGLGPDRLWSVDASPAGITEIEYLAGWCTVHRMNTLAHLDAVQDPSHPPTRVAGSRAPVQ
jgi:alpha-ribazole phosphatase